MNDFEKNIMQIFTDNPGNDNSIEISFDGIISGKDMFECMMMFLTNGLKYKYGNSQGIVDMNKLTTKNWLEVQQHFRSFGMILYYDKVYISNKKEYHTHMIDYNKVNDGMSFDNIVFTIYSQPYIYKFSFGFLN